jgi:thymidylate kinase
MKKRASVSFSGVDGAGKSTQIEALAKALSPDHSVEVLWNPLTFWPQAALSRLPSSVRARLGKGRSGQSEAHRSSALPATSRPDPGTSAGPVVKAFWFLVGTFAAVSSALSLRHRLRAAQADIVILDRFRLDTVVKLQYWYTDVPPGWLARLVLLLAPAPTVELLIRVSPEDAYARKAEEWSIVELSRHSLLYDEAATLAKATVVDGGQDAQGLTTDLLKRVRAVLDG